MRKPVAEKAIKWVVIAIAAIIVTTAMAFLTLRNWGEKQRVKQFFELVRKRNYTAAYLMWGCSEATPCRDYAFDKFMEDWGPQSAASQLRIGNSETCGSGLLVNIESAKQVESTLLIESATGTISYAPWPECPEARFRLGKWLRMKFGREPAPVP